MELFNWFIAFLFWSVLPPLLLTMGYCFTIDDYQYLNPTTWSNFWCGVLTGHLICNIFVLFECLWKATNYV